MGEDERKHGAGTGGDPAGGADPGGTRPAKPVAGHDHPKGDTGHKVGSGDRNDMTSSDPIKE